MNIRKKFSGQFIIVFVFFIFLASSIITGFIFQANKMIQYKNEISELNKEIDSTKSEINKLKKIEKSSDNDNLEHIARSRLNMVKKNEIIYVDMGKESN